MVQNENNPVNSLQTGSGNNTSLTTLLIRATSLFSKIKLPRLKKRNKGAALALKFLANIGFLLIACCGFGQISTYHFPENFSGRYNFNPSEAFENLSKKPLPGLSEEESNVFRIYNIYELQKNFDDNEIYHNWSLIENYLHKVFDTIISPQLKEKRNFYLFLKRSPQINASANDNGFLFINIGMLAHLRDEATLASVMAHEITHAVNFHSFNRYADVIQLQNNNPARDFYIPVLHNAFAKKYELVADSCSFQSMYRCGYNLKAVKNLFNIYLADEQRYIHSVFSSYSKEKENDFLKFQRKYSSHPMNEDRIKMANKYANRFNQGLNKNYIIDSVSFHYIKKIAQEECKKLLMEKCDYRECMRLSFIDYLYNSKNYKNLYYLIESIRRFLYLNPKALDKGFLSDDYSDKEFVYQNLSLLKKPVLLFQDSIQQAELIKHPLFSHKDTSFNTYAQALNYFCTKAISEGFNEAHFTLGLFYYALQNDSKCLEHLQLYVNGGSGLYQDMAREFLQHKRPFFNTGNKQLMLYDYTGLFAEDSYWGGINYYQVIQKRKLNNSLIPILRPDTTASELVFLNELMGAKPRLLHEYMKLECALFNLFSADEKEIFRKTRITAREDMEQRQLSHKYTKNLMVFAPEYYKWMKERNFGSVSFANITYEFEKALHTTEYRNDYTLYHLNFGLLRPYFKKGTRIMGTRKQSEKEMAM